jgi:orotidine-5'-phosphate decarboxylase
MIEAPRIAFALDFASMGEARDAAREVAPAIGMIKIGLELFVQAGPAAVALGGEVGLPFFLDLKLHDIPETVERAVAQAARLGARIVTVHASGGRAMLKRAAVRARAEGGTLDVCAVTVLTSLDQGDLADVGLAGAPEEAAVRLAKMAFDEGVRWFVCSPAEVRPIREALGAGATLVTPGVRPRAAGAGDQKRTATPEQAVRDGADWLVVGRPIRDATDHAAAARSIATEMASARSAS